MPYIRDFSVNLIVIS